MAGETGEGWTEVEPAPGARFPNEVTQSRDSAAGTDSEDEELRGQTDSEGVVEIGGPGRM